MKKFFVFVFMMALASVKAIEIKSGESVTINAPVREDLYVTGGTVVINAPIYGDLIVAGGTITLNDTVSFDLIVMGGEIFVNGYVADDVRSAGGRIQINGNIGGDLVVAGGTISIGKNSLVKGSLLVGGGDVTLDGTVEGQMKAGVGKLTFNGTVRKDIDFRGGELQINGQVFGKSTLAATKINIGEGASFHNDIRYWTKDGDLDFKNSIKSGGAVFDPELEMETGRWQYLGFVSVLAVLWYLGAALIMIFVIQFLFSATFKNAASTVLSESLKSLGFGFLFVVAVPVAIVFSFVTLVGIPIGLILLFGYIILFMLATAITSVVVANWINNVYYSGKWENVKLSFAAFSIFIIMKLFSLTPFVGFGITALMVCMAWGAILLNVRWRKQPVPTS
jgi:cytoskeletal protein CcmA (bactofilin family)